MRYVYLFILLFISHSIFSQDTLTVRQVFDYEIGDVFHYEENFSDYLPTLNIRRIDRYTIMGKYLSAKEDTLSYIRVVDGYTYYYATPPPTPEYQYKYHSFIDTVHYSDLDSTIFLYMASNNFEYLEDYDWQKFDTVFDISDSSVFDSESFCSTTINGYQFSDFTINHQVEFGKGIGLTKEYQEVEECLCTMKNIKLIYFKKGVDSCGIPDNRTDPTKNDLFSLIDTSKIWYNHIYIYCCEQVDTEVIGVSQNTIINDTTYNKILRATGGNTIPSQNYGFIREDSLHRIYYRTTITSPERLIYDFNIQEGDSTIVFGLMDWEKDDFISCNYICDSIRNKEYFGYQRKVYYLSTSPGHNYEHWIEGLGSSSGLLHNYDGRVGDDAFYLSCIYSGDKLLYKKYATCVRIALDVNDKIANDPLVFPNPIGTNQYLQILHIEPECILEVFDARGTLVHRQIIDSSEIAIQFNLDTGIYLYRIIENRKGSVYSGKLIFE